MTVRAAHLGIWCLILLAPVTVPAADAAGRWQILPDKSSIEWTARYGNESVHGSFPDFEADIAFDPERLDASKVEVRIHMTRIKSQDADAQQNLPGEEWFDAGRYPVAHFETLGFRLLQGDHYLATAKLCMHDKKVQMTLPFTVHFYQDNAASPPVRYARMSAETVIHRLDFGIGRGEWAKTTVLADEVRLAIRLEAKRMP